MLQKRLFHDLYVLSTIAFDQSAGQKLLSYCKKDCRPWKNIVYLFFTITLTSPLDPFKTGG